MKQVMRTCIALILCICLLTAPASALSSPGEAAAAGKIELSDKMENLFDKFVNVWSEVIQRSRVVIR